MTLATRWERRWATLAIGACIGAAACRGEPPIVKDRAPSPAPARALRVADVDRPATHLPGPEAEVTIIPLRGPVAHERAELSGLAWHGDRLVLLPQYPDRLESAHQGALFTIPRDQLAAAIAAGDTGPDTGIEPSAITLIAPGLAERIPGFEGFESIAFVADQVFMTIEAEDDGRMAGYLVRGHMSADSASLTLDTAADAVVEIAPASDIPNASDETLVAIGDRLLTIYEANGAHINPTPRAHVFDTALGRLGTTPMATLEYRVTDATAADASGRFWVVNYMYPVDVDVYRPADDALFARYGRGPSHARSAIVERLVELRHTEAGITLVDRPPVQLRLDESGRNWEGIARMGDSGFLLVTDRFPGTVLGYVPMPDAP